MGRACGEGQQEEASVGSCWQGEGGSGACGGDAGQLCRTPLWLGPFQAVRSAQPPPTPGVLSDTSLPCHSSEGQMFCFALSHSPSQCGHTCRTPVTCSKGKQSMSASGQTAMAVWSETRGQRLAGVGGVQGTLHRGSLVGGPWRGLQRSGHSSQRPDTFALSC